MVVPDEAGAGLATVTSRAISLWALRMLASTATIVVAGADLPPTIQADRALVKAERQIGEGSFSAALATLDQIVSLSEEHGDLELPASFWFHHATAAYQSESLERAIESAERYLEMAGQHGEQYVAVLELIDRVEVAQGRRLQRLQQFSEVAEQLRDIALEGSFTWTSRPARAKVGEVAGYETRSYETSISFDSTCKLAISVSIKGRIVGGWDPITFAEQELTGWSIWSLDVLLSGRSPMRVTSYRKSGEQGARFDEPRVGIELEFGGDDVVNVRSRNFHGRSTNEIHSKIKVALPAREARTVADAKRAFLTAIKLCEQSS